MVKRLLLLGVLAGLLTGRAHATQQQDFWLWFEANRDFLAQYDTNTAAVTRAVGSRLQNVDRGLTYEIGRAPDGVYEFVVSAGGVRDAFPEVRRLVRAAPAMEDWRVIAFRPRRPVAELDSLEYAGQKVSVRDIWYRSGERDGEFALTVHVGGLDADNQEIKTRVAFVMLDLALGEYDTATKLRHISFAPLPPDPEAAGLNPLGDLPEEVDRRFPRPEN